MVISVRRGRVAGASGDEKPQCAERDAPVRVRRPGSPSVTLSISRARGDATHPAPRAARTASSCWRPSARTSRRFATFAHAMRSTMPMVPISTHKTLPMSPTASRLSGRRAGRTRKLLEMPRARHRGRGPPLQPDRDHSRDISVGLGERHAGLEPGKPAVAEIAEEDPAPIEPLRQEQRRVGVQKLKLLRHDADHLARAGIHHDLRPMTDLSPPNRRRQYPYVRMTVSAVPGVSSSRENERPSMGWTPSAWSVPSVDLQALDLFGLGQTGDRRGATPKQSDRLEGAVFIAIGEEQRWARSASPPCPRQAPHARRRRAPQGPETRAV